MKEISGFASYHQGLLAKTFANRRRENKITQREMARWSGVSYASLRRFESKGEISLSSLMRVAYVLGYWPNFFKYKLSKEMIPARREYFERKFPNPNGPRVRAKLTRGSSDFGSFAGISGPSSRFCEQYWR